MKKLNRSNPIPDSFRKESEATKKISGASLVGMPKKRKRIETFEMMRKYKSNYLRCISYVITVVKFINAKVWWRIFYPLYFQFFTAQTYNDKPTVISSSNARLTKLLTKKALSMRR